MTSGKMSTAVCVLMAFAIIETAMAHSYMTYPQGTSQTCRLGGEAKFGPVMTCKGPCDFSKFQGERANDPWSWHFSPDPANVAATLRRGQRLQIKYTRNNHGPGGFVRVAMVPLDDAMDKDAHARNAFHYSCWGANPVIAKGDDLAPRDKFGFDLIGSDGREHPHAKGYYTVDVTIPDVIPDGQYYLGWVWYGGTGGKIQGNVQQEPGKYSYFGEYWTCSWITVEGGAPLGSSYTPKFVNDMRAYSTEGCMSSTNRLGDCTAEPCKGKETAYQKPIEFASGAPSPITPANFGGSAPPVDPAPSADPAPTASPAPSKDYPVDRTYFDKDLMSCLCIAGSSGCFSALADYTNGCEAGMEAASQAGECVSSCCALCSATGDRFAACRHVSHLNVCNL